MRRRGPRPRRHGALLSSHILAETEALCDRLTIIRAGRTVESGTLTDAPPVPHVDQGRIATATQAMVISGGFRGVEDIGYQAAPARAGGQRQPARTDAGTGQAGVRSLVSKPPTLEDLFLRHHGTAPTPEEVNR